MEILRDPLWQFIGVIVTVIALFLSVLFYLRQRNIKSLSYEIISDTPLFTIEEDVKDKLQVFFNGKQIEDARLVVLRIWNSGNASILSSDFERPIKFSFGEKTEILEAAMLEALPESIKEEALIKIEADEVNLQPLLLNKGDFIKLKFLISNSKESLNIFIRIVGISSIIKSDYIENLGINKYLYYLTLALAPMVVLFLLLLIILQNTISLFLVILTAFIDIISGILFLNLNNKKRR